VGYLGEHQLVSGILLTVGRGGARILTVGNATLGGFNSYGFRTGVIGTLTPTEFLSGNISQLFWNVNNQLFLAVLPSTLPNTGWSNMNINGTIFLRSDATYGTGVWTWAGIVTNPIGTSVGASIPVVVA
jgi:hypothetical protein